MNQLHKFFALSFHLRILVCKAFILLSLIRVGLWLIPFRRLNPSIQWAIAKMHKREPSSVISASEVVWAIEAATYHFPGNPRCLARALATRVLLQNYGYSCELRIGVAKSAIDGFVAHAWIESDGQVLIGGDYDLSSLTLLPSLD